jgi:hypothetical protein
MLIGILGAIVLAVVGGIAYHFLESDYEQQAALETYTLLNQFLDNRTCLNLTSVKTLVDILGQAEVGGVRVGVNPKSPIENLTNWDLQSTIFLAFEVIGAIGYGNATPRTTGGRAFCICYALLGIPLFIAAAIGISEQLVRLAEAIRRGIYRQVLRLPAPDKTLTASHVIDAMILIALGLVLFVFIPAAIFTALETWTYPEALYCCFITVLSVGFGDFVPGTESPASYQAWYRLMVGFWILIALLWFTGGIIVLIRQSLNFYETIREPLQLPGDKLDKPNQICVRKDWKKQFDKQWNRIRPQQQQSAHFSPASSPSSTDPATRPPAAVSRLQVSELDVVPTFSAPTKFIPVTPFTVDPRPISTGHVTFGATPSGGGELFVTDNISRVPVGGGS